MSQLLNKSSVLMCPHGATVSIVTSNTKVSAAGDLMVRATDTFTITGCPFPPTGTPHPCVTVQWMSHSLRNKVFGVFTLTTSSLGMCLAGDQAPQGTVQIVTTQPRVSGQ
jgi:hypothetical protein